VFLAFSACPSFFSPLRPIYISTHGKGADTIC
jgi:hypothetical protein